MQDYYTLEYSPTQKCFHYDTISSMIENNLDLCLKGGMDPPGYICLGVFKTEEERKAVTDHLRGLFLTQKGQKSMTEKELLEIKIQHLQDRKKLMTSEIDLKLRLLEEALALQKGFERSGKYSFRFEQF